MLTDQMFAVQMNILVPTRAVMLIIVLVCAMVALAVLSCAVLTLLWPFLCTDRPILKCFIGTLSSGILFPLNNRTNEYRYTCTPSVQQSAGLLCSSLLSCTV